MRENYIYNIYILYIYYIYIQTRIAKHWLIVCESLYLF
jgi:hypothetical protein